MKIQEIEASFNEYSLLFESGDLTKEEYRNLLEGLEISKVITETSDELNRKTQLHAIINTTISGLSFVL